MTPALYGTWAALIPPVIAIVLAVIFGLLLVLDICKEKGLCKCAKKAK